MSVRRYLAISAALAGAGVLLIAPSASAVGRYADPTGDAGALDITGVTVASDTNGQILFTVNLVELPSPADVATFLFLDTDRDPNTGIVGLGADYVFVVDESDNTYGLLRWTGSAIELAPSSTVTVRTTRTSVLISVNRRELGDTGGFNFSVGTMQGEEWMDSAPDLGAWNYSLQAGGPEIQAVLTKTQPSTGPRAGKLFTVTPVGLRLPPTAEISIMPQPESYGCRATLAGKPIIGTGKGRCAFAIPTSARGKPLKVRVTVGYMGSSATFAFAYRVR